MLKTRTGRTAVRGDVAGIAGIIALIIAFGLALGEPLPVVDRSIGDHRARGGERNIVPPDVRQHISGSWKVCGSQAAILLDRAMSQATDGGSRSLAITEQTFVPVVASTDGPLSS